MKLFLLRASLNLKKRAFVMWDFLDLNYGWKLRMRYRGIIALLSWASCHVCHVVIQNLSRSRSSCSVGEAKMVCS